MAGNRAADAVALLDDAAAHGGAAAADAAYPSTLLAAARSEIAALDYQDAAATLQRLVASFGSSPAARTARGLLRAPQLVSGTLVDAAGHGAAGQGAAEHAFHPAVGRLQHQRTRSTTAPPTPTATSPSAACRSADRTCSSTSAAAAG